MANVGCGLAEDGKKDADETSLPLLYTHLERK
jgi:hypothetical protein